MATIRERAGNYEVIIRLKGHPPQNATFGRKTDAKKWAADTKSAIRDGRHFKTSESKRHTVAQMIDRYIRDILPIKPTSKAKQEEV